MTFLPCNELSVQAPSARFMPAQAKLDNARLTLAGAMAELVLADGLFGAQIGDSRVYSHFQAIFARFKIGLRT